MLEIKFKQLHRFFFTYKKIFLETIFMHETINLLKKIRRVLLIHSSKFNEYKLQGDKLLGNSFCYDVCVTYYLNVILSSYLYSFGYDADMNF